MAQRPGASMDVANPFAAFLAARPPPEKAPHKFGKQGHFTGANVGPRTAIVDAVHDGPAWEGDPKMDPFSTFLSQRPLHPTQEAEQLRVEVMRTKKQLLQVALDAEMKAANGDLPVEDAARLRRMKLAQRYLEHPDRILEPYSGSHTGTTPSEGSRPASGGAGGSAKSGKSGKSSAKSAAAAASLVGSEAPAAGDGGDEAPAKAAPEGGAGQEQPPAPAAGGLAGSASAPDLHAAAAAADGSAAATPLGSTARSGFNKSMRLGSTLRSTGALTAGTEGQREEREPLLEGWYSKTRCFNMMISKGDQQCRRWSLSVPGGCYVLGNGRMPFFAGSHLLSKGYYYAFKITHADDKNQFPAEGGMQGCSLAVGVSRLAPGNKRLQGKLCPLYAYEVPGAVIVGYGSNYIDEGKWYKAPWDSNTVGVGDKVGIMITPEGDFVLFVNDEQVFRARTSLVSGPARVGRRSFFPIVDLCGRVSGLTILPLAEIPNVPLDVAISLERK